jgi:hypothetical protein
MVAKMMEDQLGECESLGLPWQREPDVSTHFGSLLPIGSLSEAGWQLPPDMSTHFGSLLPWLQK